jgi:hypothetical protein
MTSHVLCTKNEVFDAITLLTELYAQSIETLIRATIRCDFNDLLAGFEPILQVLLEVKYTIKRTRCLACKKKGKGFMLIVAKRGFWFHSGRKPYGLLLSATEESSESFSITGGICHAVT